MSLKKITSVLVSLFYCSLTSAAITSATFDAKLISFDKTTATIEVNHKKISVPKSSLNFDESNQFKNVTLSGSELFDFFKAFSQ